MSRKTVLFPTDFSDESKPALRQAAALVRDSDGILVIAHVSEPPEAFTDVGFAGYAPPTEEVELRTMLEKVVPPFEGGAAQAGAAA